MGRFSIPIVNTTQVLPTNVDEFKDNTHLIQYAFTSNAKTSTSNKTLDGGSHTSWTADKAAEFKEDGARNVFAPNKEDGAIKIRTYESNEKNFIVYADLSTSRHFGPITQMGWEHWQSSSLNHSVHLQYIAREWKKPGVTKVYTYGDSWNGEANKDSSGYYFTVRNVTSQEKLYSESGYYLQKVWFKLRTTGGIGGAFNAYCHIYNLRFGWGEGAPSTNHKMVLPGIRPIEQANQLRFGG